MINRDLGTQTGRPSVPRFPATAAVFSSPYLCIVTVDGRHGALRVDPAASRFIPMPANDAASIQNLFSECTIFCRSAGVTQIAMRQVVGKGTYGGAALTHKVEAVLQMVPNLSIELVHHSTITAWLRRNEARVPGPQSNLVPVFQEVQQRAIDLAAYIYAGTSFEEQRA